MATCPGFITREADGKRVRFLGAFAVEAVPAREDVMVARAQPSDARGWTAIRSWAAETASLFAAQALPL